MPSKNKTELLKLNQWQENEYPKMDDFNSDNKKIDDAYKNINNKLNEKANESYVNIKLKEKANKNHNHSASDINETSFRKFVTNTQLSNINTIPDKADKSYVDEKIGDIDFTELEEKIDKKADKIYVDTELKNKADKSELDKVKQSGVESNKILVDALNSKEVKASTNDSIRTNVNKVNDIELGSKVPMIPTDDLIIIGDSKNKSVELKWSSPENVVCNGVVITEFKEDILVRNENRIPININDGIQLGTFSKNKNKYTPFIDKGIKYDKQYYAVFSISTNNLVIKNAEGEIIVKEGIPIEELPVGALIQDSNSKYYGKPIVWMKLEDNHPGYPKNSTTLLSEKIISLKASDAKEPSNSNSDRKNYGNNRYIHSNIKQWLNSSASSWYSSKHSYDAPPIKDNLWDGHNPYDSEKGFMANLTPELRAAILPTSLQVLKSDKDGGGLESFTDKIFLLSCIEVGLDNATSHNEGTKFDYFKSDSDRVAYPTKEAIDNNTYTSDNLSTSKGWYWWLRTPYSSSSDSGHVRAVDSDGSRVYISACSGSRGVRPALNLDSGTVVSFKPNSDGVYELNL